MTIETDEVERIARLARLELDAGEASRYAGDLSDILTLVERMKARATDGIEPMANPLDAAQRLRADRVTETVDRAAFLANAPQSEGGLYLVPKVID